MSISQPFKIIPIWKNISQNVKLRITVKFITNMFNILYMPFENHVLERHWTLTCSVIKFMTFCNKYFTMLHFWLE